MCECRMNRCNLSSVHAQQPDKERKKKKEGEVSMKGERFYERASQKKKKKKRSSSAIMRDAVKCFTVHYAVVLRQYFDSKKKKKCRWGLWQEGMKDSFSLCALGNVLHKEKPQ